MKQTVLLAAAAAAALSLAACQKKEAAAPEATAPPAAAAPEAAAPPAAEAASAGTNAAATDTAGPVDPAPPEKVAAAKTAGATEATETAINGVALTDLYQIQAGKIAETKAQSDGVKAFAKEMVTDHTTMTNQMKHIFAALKAPVPTELGPRGKRMIDDLNAAAPADFDKMYMNQQQSAQAAELTVLRVYADAGESTDLKPAAEKRIPKVQANLDKVHELQAGLKP